MVVLVRKKKSGKEQSRRLLMVGAVLTLISLSVLGGSIAYYYTPPRITPCTLVEGLCKNPTSSTTDPVPSRLYTDEELAEFAVAKDVLARQAGPPAIPPPKVAFMFLTPGPMPYEVVWENFFKGHEGNYSVYVHASERDTLKSVWTSKVFVDRQIPSKKVFWGGIGMIDAERRLLAQALLDLDNHFFILLSEACIPLYDFNFIYKSVMDSSVSFVDNFDDPGPHGVGRFKEDGMMPEIQKHEWRKGAQWFAVMRKHALLLVSDHLYYGKFRDYCKKGDDFRNCYPDEHYVQTYLHIMDPRGLSNWTITHVDWSEGGWHPKSYAKEDVTVEALRNIQRIVEHVHVSSNLKAIKTSVPCLWDGEHRPCFLFARKFLAESVSAVIAVLPQIINNGNLTRSGNGTRL